MEHTSINSKLYFSNKVLHDGNYQTWQQRFAASTAVYKLKPYLTITQEDFNDLNRLNEIAMGNVYPDDDDTKDPLTLNGREKTEYKRWHNLEKLWAMLVMQINDKQLYILNSVQEPNTGAAWRSLQEFHTEKSKHVLRKLMRAFHELQIGTNEKLKTFIVRVNTLLVKITQHKKPNSVHPITEAMKSSAFLNALVKDIRFTTSLTILHMNKIDDAPLTFEQICDKLTSMHTAVT